MVEADTGIGPLSGHGVAIAMLAIVIGTGIAVAYAASDGRIFDPFFSPPSSDGTADQVGDQNQNNAGAEPGADSRNAFGGESINSDDGISAQSSTSETERNFNGLSEEEEKQQQLLLIGNFDWRGISVENAAETQDIIDGLIQMQQQQQINNNRAGLEYDLSANASTGIRFVVYEQVLIEEDDRLIPINEPGAESASDEEQEDEGQNIDAEPDIPDNGQEIIDLVEGSEPQEDDDATNSGEGEEAQEDEEQASNNQTNTSTEEPDEGADDEENEDGSSSGGGSGSEDDVGDGGGQIDDEPSSGGEGNSTTNADGEPENPENPENPGAE